MQKLDAVKGLILTSTVYGAITDPKKHKEGKDYKLNFKFPDENELGEPAVTLTMNLKSLSYVTELLITGRLVTEVADARKKKPFHD